MRKFKVGDKVRIGAVSEFPEDYQQEFWVNVTTGKEGVISFVDPEHSREDLVYVVGVGEGEERIPFWFPEQALTKIEDKETKEMVEFKVGDTVRAKDELKTELGGTPKGSIGKVVPTSPFHEVSLELFGLKGFYTFDFNGFVIITNGDEVEKIEAPKTEETASELYEYTFYFMTDKMPMKFRGYYVSADAEFEYYETEDDREIEVRSDSIEVKISKKVR